MPFRLSDLSRRSKSGAAEIAAPSYPISSSRSRSSSVYSRPVTASAASYDLRPKGPPAPPPPPPPPPPLMMASMPEPDRGATATPASICYDNGTGRLHDSLVQERGLPPYIQTTEQLAAFIKSQSRGQQDKDGHLPGSSNAPPSSFPSSFSPVGRSSSVYSSSARGTFYHHSPGSYERLLRPAPVAAVADPFMLAAMRHRYGARPAVARILPGATRTHEYQGFWLRRGTTHRTESDKRGPAHKSSLKRPERKDYQVESSGQLV